MDTHNSFAWKWSHHDHDLSTTKHGETSASSYPVKEVRNERQSSISWDYQCFFSHLIILQLTTELHCVSLNDDSNCLDLLLHLRLRYTIRFYYYYPSFPSSCLCLILSTHRMSPSFIIIIFSIIKGIANQRLFNAERKNERRLTNWTDANVESGTAVTTTRLELLTSTSNALTSNSSFQLQREQKHCWRSLLHQRQWWHHFCCRCCFTVVEHPVGQVVSLDPIIFSHPICDDQFFRNDR